MSGHRADSLVESMPLPLPGQPRAARLLARFVTDVPAHAWLLAGRSGHGTEAAANWAAARLLGSESSDVLRRVERGVHPDLTVVRAQGTELRADQLQDVISKATRKPFEAERQVVIIHDADTLAATNAGAANTLLRTLEEPPGAMVFLLLARRRERVLPTIRSRTVEMVFPAMPAATVAELLAAAGVPCADPEQVSRMSRGDYLRACELATRGPAADRYDTVMGGLAALCAGQQDPHDLARALRARLEQAHSEAAAAATAELESQIEMMAPADARRLKSASNPDGIDKVSKRRGRRAQVDELAAIFEDASAWYRDLIAVRHGADQLVSSVPHIPHLHSLATTRAGANALLALEALDEAESRTVLNLDPLILLESLTSELAGLAAGRIRARRVLTPGGRTPQGYELLV